MSTRLSTQRPYKRQYEYSPDVEPEIKKAYKQLLTALEHLKPSLLDKELVRKAFEVAADAHIAQKRKSGEAYIFHPIAVAVICVMELGLDVPSVVAALLHDVVEDTPVTHSEIEHMFGSEISTIVQGLTKLDHSNLADYRPSEAFAQHEIDKTDAERLNELNLQKIMETLFLDLRIILVKLSDRLHNLRTIGSMRVEKQQRIASETEFLYCPIAQQLGLNKIYSELMDICFKIKMPETYKTINDYLDKTLLERNKYITDFIEPLNKPLQDGLKMPFEVSWRMKSIYSIYAKMNDKKKPIEEIYDLFAIRVIVKNEKKEFEKSICYQAYSTVTDIYRPLPNHFKDYITHPKPNGYQSLHDVLFGPKNLLIEVQIRTKLMDDVADRGPAAHYQYKQRNKGKRGASPYEDNIKYIQNFVERVRDTAKNATSFSHFAAESGSKQIVVYSRDGHSFVFPEGATALDFAYRIHTDVGNKCQIVKVHDKPVPLDYKLKQGDFVTVVTDSKRRPTQDWLQIVMTSRAKSKIRQALRENKKQDVDNGRVRLLKKLSLMKALGEQRNVDTIVFFYQYKSHADFYEEISKGTFDLGSISNNFTVQNGLLVEKRAQIVATSNSEIIEAYKPAQVDGKTYPIGEYKVMLENSEIVLDNLDLNASCCKPEPRKPIFAYQSVSGHYRLHLQTCPNRTDLIMHQGRTHDCIWIDKLDRPFIASIEVTGVDYGVGVIANITNTISKELELNMREFHIKTDDESNFFTCNMRLEFHTQRNYFDCIKRINMLPGVNLVRLCG